MGTNYAAALREVGGLSHPSKMPCASWSTPARRCITGSVLAQQSGTICSLCYARKGFYVMRSTRIAQSRRYRRLLRALASPASMRKMHAAFVLIMRERHARTRTLLARGGRVGRDDGRVFRWHDSGDLHGIDHLTMVAEVARSVPFVSFWLPTKEAGTVAQWMRAGGTIPSNLTVRLSVPRLDRGAPPAYAKLCQQSAQVSLAAAHTDAPPDGFAVCRAASQAGECRECRACWSGEAVSYPLH